MSCKVTHSGRTRLLGIIGCPVKGNLLPRMQNAALRHLGIDAVYLPFEVPAPTLGYVLKALPALNFAGLNVTVPYKEKVLRHLDEVSEEAERLGAVNTIVVDQGRLLGHNTDGEGFMTALKVEGGVTLRDGRVMLLGAGGAAKAIAFETIRQGCRTLMIANRTRSRAATLRRRLLKVFPQAEVKVTAISGVAFQEAIAASEIIVNTTSVGMGRKDPSIVPVRYLSSAHLVIDIVYKPLQTPLLKAAEKAGSTIVNGLGMLLYQGALSFRLWTGRSAPLDVMKRALRTSPRSRS